MEAKIQNKHHHFVTLAETWHQWWEIFSMHFVRWIIISFTPWFITYLVVINMLGGFKLALNHAKNWSDIFGPLAPTLYLFSLGALIILFFQIYGSLLLFYGIANRAQPTKKIFWPALKKIWAYILLGLICTGISSIILAASYLLIMLIGIVIGLFDLQAVAPIFKWLELIPFLSWLVAGVLFIFSPFCLVTQKISAWAAVKQGFNLIRGYFWPLLMRLFIVYSIMATLAIILNLIPWVGPILAVTLVGPALSIYLYVLYKDIQLLKQNQ